MSDITDKVIENEQGQEMVCISVERYNDLLDSEAKLCALENGGVDNWSFYGEAMAEYWESKESEEE